MGFNSGFKGLNIPDTTNVNTCNSYVDKISGF